MFSAVLASLALLVSLYAIFQTKKFNQKQLELIDRETELTRILTHKEGKEFLERRNATVSARLYKVSKSTWKFRVFNTGPGDARNVHVLLNENNSLISDNALSGKFPMKKMEAGQSVEAPAFVHMQSNSKETVTLQWDDDNGHAKTNEVEITL